MHHQKYVTQQSPHGFSIKPYFARRRLRDCMWTTACGRQFPILSHQVHTYDCKNLIRCLVKGPALTSGNKCSLLQGEWRKSARQQQPKPARQ